MKEINSITKLFIDKLKNGELLSKENHENIKFNTKDNTNTIIFDSNKIFLVDNNTCSIDVKGQIEIIYDQGYEDEKGSTSDIIDADIDINKFEISINNKKINHRLNSNDIRHILNMYFKDFIVCKLGI